MHNSFLLCKCTGQPNQLECATVMSGMSFDGEDHHRHHETHNNNHNNHNHRHNYIGEAPLKGDMLQESSE